MPGLGKKLRVVELRFEATSPTFMRKAETSVLCHEEGARVGPLVTCDAPVEPLQWPHLEIFTKECVIMCSQPRGRLSNDGKVYSLTQPCEERGKHITREFEASLGSLMGELPVKRSGGILGESGSRMLQMLCANLKAAHARFSFANLLWAGADKMNQRNGHNYLTVLADLRARRVLFATPGKESSVSEVFTAELRRQNGHPEVNQDVVMDISDASTKRMSAIFAKSQVAYDKFHVIQGVVMACHQARKAESWVNAGSGDRLERTRWMRLKKAADWTTKEFQKWESMALERGGNGHGLRDEAAASRHLRMEGRRGREETVRQRVRMGASNAGTDREVARADGQSGPDDRRELGGNLGPFDSALTTACMEGAKQSVLVRKARGPRMPEGGTHDCYALLRRRETHPAVLLPN
jgi:hypothetical protein